jgi:hypothetical protein
MPILLSPEDEFLSRLARGGLVDPEEWAQMASDLPPEALAPALARRFNATGETRMLVEAARLYLQAGLYYHAIEACSRAPRLKTMQAISAQALPHLRGEWAGEQRVGKLMDEAFLVIDLSTGQVTRFPPLLPARG